MVPKSRRREGRSDARAWIVQPGDDPGKTTVREAGERNRMMVKPRHCPRWPTVERTVMLVVSAVNALAELINAIHHVS
jgi:hypothetical protein